ncbi:hypothetical protein PUMCH_004570 [Australozyma saopauloensis]|uniref:Uncharacterized protein n=1 Tax=Australozyma saopauloensis TaxID=291208 RepID=A0AAX4HFN0_9ASCO|nr:hypothetical protein PUMCH_004570 [[Candida] saopauloensis]
MQPAKPIACSETLEVGNPISAENFDSNDKICGRRKPTLAHSYDRSADKAIQHPQGAEQKKNNNVCTRAPAVDECQHDVGRRQQEPQLGHNGPETSGKKANWELWHALIRMVLKTAAQRAKFRRKTDETGSTPKTKAEQPEFRPAPTPLDTASSTPPPPRAEKKIRTYHRPFCYIFIL